MSWTLRSDRRTLLHTSPCCCKQGFPCSKISHLLCTARSTDSAFHIVVRSRSKIGRTLVRTCNFCSGMVPRSYCCLAVSGATIHFVAIGAPGVSVVKLHGRGMASKSLPKRVSRGSMGQRSRGDPESKVGLPLPLLRACDMKVSWKSLGAVRFTAQGRVRGFGRNQFIPERDQHPLLGAC